MNNHTKTLQALVAAGDEAIGGEWSVGMYALSVEADYEEDGKPWHTKILDIRGWGHLTGKGHARAMGEKEAKKVQEHNADFLAQSANARPALKALLDELKEKDRVMAVMAEALDQPRFANGTRKFRAVLEVRKQALAQFEKINNGETK